ncbi:MAG: SCP2 sterol-binding domain-containing protein [Candidatus Hydrogenedentes bacterium]|nr:SCP2 sterol-binding domain-containing protein [Candidatus Hydrogenedentota bacterium]
MTLESPGDARHRCLTYFQEFLPAILGQLLLEDLRSLTTAFAIHVTDLPEAPWRLAITDGCLTAVGPSVEQAPVCTFALDSATLLEIVAARIVPQEAFFEMKIALEGDMEMGLTLSTVLAPFFARFPFTGPAGA